MENGRPLWQLVTFFVLVPPIMAFLVRLMSHGWANIVQSGNISEATRRRQRVEFWGLLVLLYLAVAFIFIYAHFRH
jgi:hypothetical protein